MMRKSLLFAMSCFLTLGVNGSNVDVKLSDTKFYPDHNEATVKVKNATDQVVKVSVDVQGNNNSNDAHVLFGNRVMQPGDTENVKVMLYSNDNIKIMVNTSTGERKVFNIGNVKTTVTNEDEYTFGFKNGRGFVRKEANR